MRTGARILILHWDEYALMALERALENCGYCTTTTWSAEEALRLLGRESFDLLLVSDHPPAVDAGRLLDRMKTAGLSVRSVLIPNDGPAAPADLLVA